MTVPISQNKVLTKMEKLALLMDYEIGLLCCVLETNNANTGIKIEYTILSTHKVVPKLF